MSVGDLADAETAARALREQACGAFVDALWGMLQTAAAAAPDDVVLDAAARCADRFAAAVRGENHFVLQQRAGELFANGARMRPVGDGFAAIAGMAAWMADAGLSGLLFQPPVRVGELAAFARACHRERHAEAIERALSQQGDRGIFCGASA